MKKVSCGLHHTAFVTEEGNVYTCGNNENGQLGLKDTRSRYMPTVLEELSQYHFRDVACGYYHTLALTEQGEVFVFGRNDRGQLGIVNSMTNNRQTMVQDLNKSKNSRHLKKVI